MPSRIRHSRPPLGTDRAVLRIKQNRLPQIDRKRVQRDFHIRRPAGKGHGRLEHAIRVQRHRPQTHLRHQNRREALHELLQIRLTTAVERQRLRGQFDLVQRNALGGGVVLEIALSPVEMHGLGVFGGDQIALADVQNPAQRQERAIGPDARAHRPRNRRADHRQKGKGGGLLSDVVGRHITKGRGQATGGRALFGFKSKGELGRGACVIIKGQEHLRAQGLGRLIQRQQALTDRPRTPRPRIQIDQVKVFNGDAFNHRQRRQGQRPVQLIQNLGQTTGLKRGGVPAKRQIEVAVLITAQRDTRRRQGQTPHLDPPIQQGTPRNRGLKRGDRQDLSSLGVPQPQFL